MKRAYFTEEEIDNLKKLQPKHKYIHIEYAKTKNKIVENKTIKVKIKSAEELLQEYKK